MYIYTVKRVVTLPYWIVLPITTITSTLALVKSHVIYRIMKNPQIVSLTSLGWPDSVSGSNFSNWWKFVLSTRAKKFKILTR